MRLLAVVALLLAACGGNVQQICPEQTDDAGSDASVVVDSGVTPDADAGPCECEFFESDPSPTAIYVGPCSDVHGVQFGLYDESAIVAPNHLLICSGAPK
jgi:hypothetical protein